MACCRISHEADVYPAGIYNAVLRIVQLVIWSLSFWAKLHLPSTMDYSELLMLFLFTPSLGRVVGFSYAALVMKDFSFLR